MYFKIFPKNSYAFDLKNDSLKTVTNIFTRFKIRSKVLQNSLVFEKYQVQDGESPEIISYKLYGDPKYHWIICMCNDIIDPQFDLPLNSDALEKNIIKKYNLANIDQATSTHHHYELVVDKLITQADGFTSESTEKSETTLQQYDYTSNTIITVSVNSPVTQTVQLRANNADLTSPIIHTMALTSTYRDVNIYDYEVSENEKKRTLNVLKQQFIPLIYRELEYIINA
jgi:hypothetical protein